MLKKRNILFLLYCLTPNHNTFTMSFLRTQLVPPISDSPLGTHNNQPKTTIQQENDCNSFIVLRNGTIAPYSSDGMIEFWDPKQSKAPHVRLQLVNSVKNPSIFKLVPYDQIDETAFKKVSLYRLYELSNGNFAIQIPNKYGILTIFDPHDDTLPATILTDENLWMNHYRELPNHKLAYCSSGGSITIRDLKNLTAAIVHNYSKLIWSIEADMFCQLKNGPLVAIRNGKICSWQPNQTNDPTILPNKETFISLAQKEADNLLLGCLSGQVEELDSKTFALLKKFDAHKNRVLRIIRLQHNKFITHSQCNKMCYGEFPSPCQCPHNKHIEELKLWNLQDTSAPLLQLCTPARDFGPNYRDIEPLGDDKFVVQCNKTLQIFSSQKASELERALQEVKCE